MTNNETIKTVSLNIMLLKSDCNFDDRNDYINNYTDKNIISEDNDYFLYKNGRAGNKPTWVTDFDEKIWNGEIKSNFANTASEGLSVIKNIFYNERNYLFAINFAQGRFNIVKEKIEDTFGIYTAIALIEQGASIRRAGTRNISSNPKNTEFQSAQEISSEEFNSELDDNDIIRHLNAIANSSTISSVIGKYGPLNIRMRFTADEIPCWNFLNDRLINLIDLFENIQDNSEVINKFFKGLRPLPSEKQNELNDAIICNLNSENSNFFLFEPEIDYDPTLIARIRYKLNNNPREIYENDKLSLDYYLGLAKKEEQIDIIKDKILLINEDGNIYKDWSVYKCLYGEVKIDDQVYILSNSVWYGLPNSKYERIKQNIEDIYDDLQVDDSVKINTTNKIKEKKLLQKDTEEDHKPIDKERIFNRELCNQLSGELFDQISKQIKIDDDKMEVCDIFDSNNKEFIHAKIGTKAATLSHLFNQGYASARAFASMKDLFVQEVNKKLDNPENLLSTQKNSHQGYTVRYLIINSKADNKLTFISKLSLDRIITDLKGFGYEVKLSWVNDIDLDPNIETI
mgnify:FL=1